MRVICNPMIRMDGFDRLPDSLILLIFNSVSDVKTLTRCRSVSKRFNSLVPQTESLLLNVDCVVSAELESDSFLYTFIASLLKSFQDFFKSDQRPGVTRMQNSPAQILSRFERIRSLQIELPAGDLNLEKGVVIKWRAEFGKTVKSCVILGFRPVAGYAESAQDEVDFDFAGGLKTGVLWTISALIAASARHYLLKEVVKEHEEIERLVLKDREGEGTVEMGKEGLRECMLETEERGSDGWAWNRTVVPSVRMRMRQERRMQLKNGLWVEVPTLVVVRPCVGKDGGHAADTADAELALNAFGSGVYGDAVQVLLKGNSYFLEMNSF